MALVANPIQVLGKRSLPELDSFQSPKRHRSKSVSSDCSDYADSPTTPLTPLSTKSTTRPLKYHCDFAGCQKAFSRPVRLEEHKRSHTNERIFKCPYTPCTKDFLRDSHLKHHIKSAHTSERNYVCAWEGCGKTFVTGTRLRKHEEAHVKREMHTCKDYPPCEQSFRKHTTLQKHIQDAHLGGKVFHCQHQDESGQCQENFASLSKLRAHEGDAHGAAKYQCADCSTAESVVSFVLYRELQAHMKLVHPPSCPHCGLVCSSNGEVSKHIDIQHSGVTLNQRRVHVCLYEGCDKSFTKSGNLKIHIQSAHSAVKRFQCGKTDVSASHGMAEWAAEQGCGQAFTSKQSLESHIRRHHLGTEAPGRRNRTRPMLSAPGTPCEQYMGCIVENCPYRFKRSIDLEDHVRNAHGLEDAAIIEALDEWQALHGGRFWLGGDVEYEDYVGLGTEAFDIRDGLLGEQQQDPTIASAAKVDSSSNVDPSLV